MLLEKITQYAERMQEQYANMYTDYPTAWNTDDPVLTLLLTIQETVAEWANVTYKQPYAGVFVRNVPWMVYDALREQHDERFLVNLLCDLEDEQQELGEMTEVSHAAVICLGWLASQHQIDRALPALHDLSAPKDRDQGAARDIPSRWELRKLLQVSLLNIMFDVLAEEASNPTDQPWVWREPLVALRVVEQLSTATAYEPYDSILDLVEQDMRLAMQIGQQQEAHDEYNRMVYGGAFY